MCRLAPYYIRHLARPPLPLAFLYTCSHNYQGMRFAFSPFASPFDLCPGPGPTRSLPRLTAKVIFDFCDILLLPPPPTLHGAFILAQHFALTRSHSLSEFIIFCFNFHSQGRPRCAPQNRHPTDGPEIRSGPITSGIGYRHLWDHRPPYATIRNMGGPSATRNTDNSRHVDNLRDNRATSQMNMSGPFRQRTT